MNARNASGNTPLHVCAVNNQEPCARQLLFRGADRQALNYANQTPYQVAVIAGNMELAEIIQSYRQEDVGMCPPVRERGSVATPPSPSPCLLRPLCSLTSDRYLSASYTLEFAASMIELNCWNAALVTFLVPFLCVPDVPRICRMIYSPRRSDSFAISVLDLFSQLRVSALDSGDASPRCHRPFSARDPNAFVRTQRGGGS